MANSNNNKPYTCWRSPILHLHLGGRVLEKRQTYEPLYYRHLQTRLDERWHSVQRTQNDVRSRSHARWGSFPITCWPALSNIQDIKVSNACATDRRANSRLDIIVHYSKQTYRRTERRAVEVDQKLLYILGHYRKPQSNPKPETENTASNIFRPQNLVRVINIYFTTKINIASSHGLMAFHGKLRCGSTR